jgi:hypothetical protein
MRKLIATLAIVGLSSFAYAQDVSVNGEQKTNAREHAKSRTHQASEQQVPRQSQELRNDFRGRADVNVRDKDRTNTDVNVQGQNKSRTDVNVQDQNRTRTDVNVQDRDRTQDRTRSRTDVNINAQPTYENRTVTTHHEERAENRGGKFFFHDREIHRHPGFDHSDWHFRIGHHDRNWYYEHYQTIIFVDGCWYYEDGGFLWPAYGFDPSCDYPDQFIVFQFNG